MGANSSERSLSTRSSCFAHGVFRGSLLVACTVALFGCGKTQSHGQGNVTKPGSPADEDPPFESGKRLRARVLDDGAGSLVFVEWEDTQLGTACVFRTAADGAIRCLPSVPQPLTHYFADTIYTDEACTAPGLALTMAVSPPDYGVEGAASREPCEPQRFVVRRRGRALDPLEMVYHRSTADGTCQAIAAGLPADTAVYALEEELPPASFLRAERAIGASGTRLKPLELRGEDGSFARDGIWDQERSEECSRQVTDGRWCVPQVAWVEDAFSDPGCTTSVALPPGELPQIDRSCRVFGIGAKDAGFDSCGLARDPELYELGSASNGKLFMLDGDACGSQDTDEDYYPIISPLPDGALGSVETTYMGKGRLRVEALLAEDGTRLEAAERVPRLQDSGLGIQCSPVLGCDGSVLCKPLEMASDFVDDQCKTPAFESPVSPRCGDVEPPIVAPPIANDSCWQGDMLKVGDTLASDAYYVRSDGRCLQQSLPTDGRAVRTLTPAGTTPIVFVDRVE